MTKGGTLLVIGRNNRNKKSRGIASLIEKLNEAGVPVRFYESKTTATGALLEERFQMLMQRISFSCEKDYFLSKLARRMIKAALLLCYPNRWAYYFYRAQERHHTSTRELIGFIRKLEDKNITLLTHSAGGIAGSRVEHLEKVNGHICFGYPFKHPLNREEPRRTRHLKHVKKPFLIVQGNQDEYGSKKSTSCYTLSPAITLRPIDATHDYEDIPAAEFEALFIDIQAFLGQRRQLG